MKRNSQSRLLWVESLESRYLLTACAPLLNPSTNDAMPADVNADGDVGFLDALIVVNELHHRAYSDPVTGALSCASSATNFIDPNGDSLVSPLDALMVVNVIRGRIQLGLEIGTSAEEAVIRVPHGVSSFTPLDDRVTIREGANKTLISATVSLVDIRGGPFRVMPVDTQDTSITASFDADKNVLQLTGEDSIANYVEVLSGLVFRYEPVIESRFGSFLTLSVTINDGHNTASAPAYILAEGVGSR